MPMISNYRLPYGLYVLKKDKAEVSVQIREISHSLGEIQCDRQFVLKYKASIHKLKALLKDCFVETRAQKCACDVLKCFNIDNFNQLRNIWPSFSCFVFDLNNVVAYSIRFDELPSCRDILKCSPEEVVKKAVNLTKSGIVKMATSLISFGSNIYTFSTVSDVKHFYTDSLSMMTREDNDNIPASPVEIVFENKCQEELEYCRLASLKVSGELTQDALDMGIQIAERYRNASTMKESSYNMVLS